MSGPSSVHDPGAAAEEAAEAVRVLNHLTAIRKALRSEGFRSNTMVVEGVVHVWSDDAFHQIDQSDMRDRVARAPQQVTPAPDAADVPDGVTGPGPIDWHTWVVDS